MDTLTGYLGLDFETTSACDIKNGAWAYAHHESTRVWCAVFAYAERGSSHYHYQTWEPGDELPGDVRDFIVNGGRVVAHNAFFEQSVIAAIMGPLYGWPVPELDQWVDTAVLSLALNLPVALEGTAAALGCPIQKDVEGAKLMKAMAVRKEDPNGGWLDPHDNPENRARLLEYCAVDVGAMLDCLFRMPPLSVTEQLVYRVDQRVNRRGVFLDRKFARQLLNLTKRRAKDLSDKTKLMTSMELHSSTSTPALKKWLVKNGVELPLVKRKKKDGTVTETASADKTAVASILKNEKTPEHVREVLANRVEANKTTSLAKLARVETMVTADGRLRGALAFQGAHTGRWTSHGLQIHNLPKVKLSDEANGLAMCLAQLGALDWLEFFEGNVLATLSQMLRSVIAAPPGKEIIAADYSAIEARVLAWLAEDEQLLEQFRRGNDVYVYTAESIGAWTCRHAFRKGCVTCEQNRHLGKITSLALGYGMGKVKFADTGGAWGVMLPRKQWAEIHSSWRTANPYIVGFWNDLEEAVRDVVEGRTEAAKVGRIFVSRNKSCLFLTLPSGRSLRYWRPRIREVEKTTQTINEHGEIVESTWSTEEIQFFSMGDDKKSMKLDNTYGGKLVENVTQAIARDLLADALIRIEAVEPYEIVMHVHDSIAAEVPEGAGDVDDFCRLMAHPPRWADGLPLAVEGYRDTRFRG